MIVKAESLSSAQKSVIEEILGRQILDAESVSVRVFEMQQPATDARELSAKKLLQLLEEKHRPRTGVSEDELESAILEALRSERPGYAQVS